jgi:hypothetical protein
MFKIRFSSAACTAGFDRLCLATPFMILGLYAISTVASDDSQD